MANDQADLLAHPVRLRIILALSQNEEMTAQQLGEALTDIPQATLYRHLPEAPGGRCPACCAGEAGARRGGEILCPARGRGEHHPGRPGDDEP